MKGSGPEKNRSVCMHFCEAFSRLRIIDAGQGGRVAGAGARGRCSLRWLASIHPSIAAQPAEAIEWLVRLTD